MKFKESSIPFEKEIKEKEEFINKEFKTIFGVPEDAPEARPVPDAEKILYGDRQPDGIFSVEVSERVFGYETYQPTNKANGVWLVTEHGHCGRARDWAKLAKLASEKGFGILAFDMHKEGKNIYEKMSMKIDQWMAVTQQAPAIFQKHNISPKKLIFLGQSSGGSAGAALATEGREKHPYDGVILIGPTLTTADPEALKVMDKVIDQHLGSDEDIMIDWKWLAPLIKQFKDEKLNEAYAGYLSTLPGFPYRHSRDSMTIDDSRILEKLNKIDIPLIITRGEFDEVDHQSLNKAQEILKEKPNPNITFGTIKGAGHQAHVENPELVMDLIEQLLVEIEKD